MNNAIVSFLLKKYKAEIITKIEAMKTSLAKNVSDFSSTFNDWKTDWTPQRAQKLDNLDMSVSGAKGEVLESFQQAGEVLGAGLQAINSELATKASQDSVDTLITEQLEQKEMISHLKRTWSVDFFNKLSARVLGTTQIVTQSNTYTTGKSVIFEGQNLFLLGLTFKATAPTTSGSSAEVKGLIKITSNDNIVLCAGYIAPFNTSYHFWKTDTAPLAYFQLEKIYQGRNINKSINYEPPKFYNNLKIEIDIQNALTVDIIYQGV